MIGNNEYWKLIGQKEKLYKPSGSAIQASQDLIMKIFEL